MCVGRKRVEKNESGDSVSVEDGEGQKQNSTETETKSQTRDRVVGRRRVLPRPSMSPSTSTWASTPGSFATAGVPFTLLSFAEAGCAAGWSWGGWRRNLAGLAVAALRIRLSVDSLRRLLLLLHCLLMLLTASQALAPLCPARG